MGKIKIKSIEPIEGTPIEYFIKQREKRLEKDAEPIKAQAKRYFKTSSGGKDE